MVLDGSWAASRPGQVSGNDHRDREDELAAMTDLRLQLDERRRAGKLADIDRRGRLAYLEGAEAQSLAGRAGR